MARTPDKIVIVGAGGFGREVLDVIQCVEQRDRSMQCLGFLVDREYAEPGSIVNGVPVLGDMEWLVKGGRGVKVFCAIGAPHLRFQMTRRLERLGAKFCTIVHPSAVLSRRVTLGEGSIVTAGCILTTDVVIGRHVHLNLDSTVGHDVVIKSFSTISPGCHISGNVKIGEGAFIGTGVNILEKLEVGAWSRIGAGSAVLENVEPNTTVVGVPGRVAKRMPVGWHLK